MSEQSVHFMSLTCEWGTPQGLFDQLDAEFHFTLDVCADAGNTKCVRYFANPENKVLDPTADGLAQSWAGEVCWMNPPYGLALRRWISKASAEAAMGAVVVALVPSRTDTAWWHNHCMKHEIRFIRRRLKFGGATGYAPFPSAIVVFR